MSETNDIFSEIVKRGPSVESLVIVLKHMKNKGRHHEVIKACIRFLRIYPDNIRLGVLLAESYAELGFISLAQAQLERVASMIDTLSPAYRQLAEIYAKQKRFREAADAIKRYLAHQPDQPEALKFLEEMEKALLSKDVLRKDEAHLEDLPSLEDEPADAVVDFATPTIAELYYTQGRIDAAVKTYEKVLTSNPDDRESLRRLNELKKGMTDDASGIEEKGAGDLGERKKKMIMILERWLPKIQEMRDA
ncbi:MAG: tetratricopeptide repeat protein [Deltaproteobacteria bacterium]|nr:tetratricopeptide repeat protein [Deltaproteobacteria bacterium]